ncbi:MAG: hypothetical protein KKC85_11985 [Gammaproteobacteria bacterium]|nr:hypothetical protein [Gammaproteobacteria bacterium]MBU1440653.1 hypothetical protein [Gammaproteobacteria bacterium]MBU2287146.1 hypothetical protein [Gammaproteobacteria bacterium]
MKKPMPATMRPRERGVVLIFCLIILVVLLAGGVAVVRSMNTSLFGAGNLAFKRDLVNRGEQAAARALTLFKTGGALATTGADIANVQAANYVAYALPTNARGVPTVMLDNTQYGVYTTSANDIVNDGVTVHYLIERLCNAAGTPASLGAKGCVYAPQTTAVTGGSAQRAREDIPPASTLIYRLTVRVDGPRDTQVFLQSSFTKPEL